MDTTTSELNPASLPPELRALLDTRDTNEFEASLDALFAHRQRDLFRALGHLTRDLHNSIMQLTLDGAKPPAGAPVARQSLQEALAMSARAAHETLAMTERLRPQASALSAQAHALAADDSQATAQLARDAGQFAEDCLDDFTHLIEKQSWQDLSGQRLQRVAKFIDKVERSLVDLVRLTGSISGTPAVADPHTQAVSNQDEVDRLLSEFGF